jgi:rod shape-determining protein MreC
MVRHDSFTRGGLHRRVEVVSGLHFFLMFLAAGLLVLTRVEHPVVVGLQAAGREAVQPVVDRIDQWVRPVRGFSRNAVGFFMTESDFHRLEREVVTLRQQLARQSDVARENAQLRELAKVVEGAPVAAVTADVIGGAQGLFSKSVTIGAGAEHGLRYGQPVFSEEGLFGRLIAVSQDRSKVLVLNDMISRIPVEIGKSQRQALMVGDNSELPRLVYLNNASGVRADEIVVTSGASGEFPRGIRIGRVVMANGEVRVRTSARLLAGSYLTVLLYKLPSAGLATNQSGTASARPEIDKERLAAGRLRGDGP